jgi:hypothetical protein
MTSVIGTPEAQLERADSESVEARKRLRVNHVALTGAHLLAQPESPLVQVVLGVGQLRPGGRQRGHSLTQLIGRPA